MVNNLASVSLKSFLPPNLLKDEENAVLIEVMDKQIAKLYTSMVDCMIMARIDELDHDMLDLLATQYDTPFYSQELTLEQKRDLIKNTISIHKQNGTVGAVESALRSIFNTGTISEWHEYEGNPYHFKIKLDGNKFSLGRNHSKQIETIVNKTKNIRSRLEKVEINVDHHTQAHMGTVARVGKITTITPATEVTINMSSNHEMYAGAYVRTVKKVTIQGG